MKIEWFEAAAINLVETGHCEAQKQAEALLKVLLRRNGISLDRRGAVVNGVEHVSTSLWRGFESRWFCRSGFEFAKTPLSILNH